MHVGSGRSRNEKLFRIFKGTVDIIVLNVQSVKGLVYRFYLLDAREREVPVVKESVNIGEFPANEDDSVTVKVFLPVEYWHAQGKQ